MKGGIDSSGIDPYSIRSMATNPDLQNNPELRQQFRESITSLFSPQKPIIHTPPTPPTIQENTTVYNVPDFSFQFDIENCRTKSKYNVTFDKCLTITRTNNTNEVNTNKVNKIYLFRFNNGEYRIRYNQDNQLKDEILHGISNTLGQIISLLFFNELQKIPFDRKEERNEFSSFLIRKLATDIRVFLEDNPKIFQRIREGINGLKINGGNKRKTRKSKKTRKQRKTNKRRKSYRK